MMTSSLIALAIDGIITVLLAVTIYYCVRLNSYIKAIKDSKSELSEVIAAFDESTARAQQSITELKKATKAAVDVIQVRIEKAEFLADDLAYLIDRANKMDDKRAKKNTSSSDTRQAQQTQSAAATPPAKASTPVKHKKSKQPSGLEQLAASSSRSKKDTARPSSERADDSEPTQAEIALMEALKSIR